MKQRVLWVFPQGAVGDGLADNTLANVTAARMELNHPKRGRGYKAAVISGGMFQEGQLRPISITMKEELGPVNVLVYTSERSVITREDVTIGLEDWAEHGITLKNSRFTIVSEYWHSVGICVLFLRRGAFPRIVSSGYKISQKEWIERVGRILYYIFDPYARTRRSREMAEARRTSV